MDAFSHKSGTDLDDCSRLFRLPRCAGALAPVSILLTLGFLVFAVGNFTAMGRVANQQLELQSLLKKSGSLKSESYPQPREIDGIRVTLDAPAVCKLEALHLVGLETPRYWFRSG